MSNILIIKHGSLGDIAQASGAIQDISENHKDDKIYLLTTKSYFDLFKKNPFITDVILDKRLSRFNLIYLYSLIKDIKKYNFAKVYDLQNSSRTSFYKKILFSSSNLNTWSSSETTLPSDKSKEEFDKNPVLDRFDHQLKTSGLMTNHTMSPDFSWSCSDISNIKLMQSFGQIILASESPRRQALLRQIGLDFSVKISGIDEDISIDLPPNQLAEHLAREKAHAVAVDYSNQLVIGADTIVVFDDQVLGKPKDHKESFNMLSTLSGNTHQVITGVTLKLLDKNIDDTFHDITKVTFNTLSESDINYYINTYNPFDKAGSYGIQDWSAVFVKHIDGCFYNVMGLPLANFWERINKLG